MEEIARAMKVAGLEAEMKSLIAMPVRVWRRFSFERFETLKVISPFFMSP